MSATRLGQLLFAVGFIVLGAMSLVAGDFAFVWQPVPKWVGWREPLAYASGLMLLGGGLGLLFRRTARMAALLLTANMVVWLLLLRLPPALATPGIEARWLGFGETLMLVTGGWILVAAVSSPTGGPGRWPAAAGDSARPPRLLYAAALLPVGLSHFFYLQDTASLIPGWIPFRPGFACLTGAGHLAAGLALLSGVLPRLAATAEAVMISIFTVVVGGAGVLGAPGSRFQWTAMFISAAMNGAAWTVAGSLDGEPWGLRPAQPRRAAEPTLQQ